MNYAALFGSALWALLRHKLLWNSQQIYARK